MRTRSLSLAAIAAVSLLAGCEGASSTTGVEDIPFAGVPSEPAVKTIGKVVGGSTSTDTSTETPTPVASSIVGTWSGTQSSMTLTLVMKTGGTGSYSMSMAGTVMATGSLTWTGNGPSYTVTVDGSTASAKVSGTTLTFVDPDDVTWTLKKN